MTPEQLTEASRIVQAGLELKDIQGYLAHFSGWGSPFQALVDPSQKGVPKTYRGIPGDIVEEFGAAFRALCVEYTTKAGKAISDLHINTQAEPKPAGPFVLRRARNGAWEYSKTLSNTVGASHCVVMELGSATRYETEALAAVDSWGDTKQIFYPITLDKARLDIGLPPAKET